MHDDTYGLFRRTEAAIPRLENRIEKIIERGASTPAAKGELAKLMAIRDALMVKAAAKKGAALAAASIPGVAGGLAGSGIRGMDVVEHEFTPEVLRQHNIEGALQGLRQASVAPPGSGRLVPINFVVAGAVNPIQTLVVPGGGGIAAGTALVTIAVNWAVLKIVALTTQTTAAAVGNIGLMQDFRIGGSPNLFLPEDWVLMDDYDTDKEQFTGLRAYPVLSSPNTALVTASVFGPAANAGTNLFAAISLVTEVLRDDAFGPGLPGAYAR
jgi:hypothetical protein